MRGGYAHGGLMTSAKSWIFLSLYLCAIAEGGGQGEELVAVLEEGMNRNIFVFMILVLTIQGANAAYDYSIAVGTHRVSFNTSSPIWEITHPFPSVTNFGYEETYTPTNRRGTQDNPTYTYSSTTLTSRNDSGPSLVVEVRDFDNPIPLRNVYSLEIDTIYRFLNFILIEGTVESTHQISGNGIAVERNGESPGAIVDWPSDQVEIIIVGSLPSHETWEEIARSLKLER